MRYVTTQIKEDLQEKMVFLAGPRQVGKTTVSTDLLKELRAASWSEGYFSWDDAQDRKRLLEGALPGTAGLVVLDEIHKLRTWRQLVKGLFDKRRHEYSFLITGSAKLDLYRRGGDSLQGRYHFLRLHPLSFREIGGASAQDLEALLTLGGFPEPFFSGSLTRARRWSRSYAQRLVREEVTGLENVRDLGTLELLNDRLPDLVGSPLSYNALREDLGVAHATVVRWVDILERLYGLFRLAPFGGPRIRAVKKEVKHYHFDWTRVGSEALRFENLVACHLLKECQFLEDTQGRDLSLRYFRDVDKREVDFVVVERNAPRLFVECKTSDGDASPHLRYLSERFPGVPAVQVVLTGKRDWKLGSDIRIIPAVTYLAAPLDV